ncbi:GNAT family N-acetyltransferase [Xanthocytophaga flava]|uniref:GNAT family N-acetyltransferase n=1 Tax=Xanthocytophaga flava TaxID=3048013 RepID=UPI0028D00B59|nr:GNAT family protein [Xanthocytophaga flavus]MDJ1466736.1 GNAT family protein [Xanthocytophaga flavus]
MNDIQLLPLTLQMAPTLAAIANDKDIWLQVRDRLPHPYHLQDAESFISIVSSQEQQLIRGIFFKQQLCGVISITPLHDIHRVSAEIGYFLGKSWWGKGIATTAVSQITQMAFATFPIERIFAGVFSHNKSSMRVLEKNGFLLEGVAQRSVIKENVLLDEHIYALYRQI